MKNLVFYILWPVIAGLVFAGVILGVTQGTSFFQGPDPALLEQTPDFQEPQSGQELFNFSFKGPIASISQAVVSINFEAAAISSAQVYYSERIRSLMVNTDDIENSQGSGVIISSDGYIITSYHIFNTEEPSLSVISITMHDGRTLAAHRVAQDELNDLVLLKVNETNLPYAHTGNPRPLSVGDVVLAVGNPRNLGQSVSLGIISALLSSGDSYLIQTDAAINPGNSGGALIDYEGNLIGINSTIVSESGGSEGIGFATPANKVMRLLSAYLKSSTTGYLGVSAELYSLDSFFNPVVGLRVVKIIEGGPAEQSGIQTGDIITAINDVKVETADGGRNFTNALAEIEAGERVFVKVFRDGDWLDIPTIFGEEHLFFRLGDMAATNQETGAAPNSGTSPLSGLTESEISILPVEEN